MANQGRRADDGTMLGVTGCAWVARRVTITKLKFFAHGIIGGGDDIHFNLWLGATDRRSLPAIMHEQQRWYFGEGKHNDHAGMRRILHRYRKRLQVHVKVPATCAYLPCTLVHMYHGELESKQVTLKRHYHLVHRQFRASIHTQQHPEFRELLTWTDDFRDPSLQTDLRLSFERSQSVREQVLLKLANMKRCLEDAHRNVRNMLQLETASQMNEETTRHELISTMRTCLQAIDTIKV